MYKSQVIIASINVTRIILHIVPCPFGLGAIKGLGLVLCRLYFFIDLCAEGLDVLVLTVSARPARGKVGGEYHRRFAARIGWPSFLQLQASVMFHISKLTTQAITRSQESSQQHP